MLLEHSPLKEHFEALKNFFLGMAGISIGLQDITNVCQAITVIGGAMLVLIQLYKLLKK